MGHRKPKASCLGDCNLVYWSVKGGARWVNDKPGGFSDNVSTLKPDSYVRCKN
jgi:hypothetical protein